MTRRQRACVPVLAAIAALAWLSLVPAHGRADSTCVTVSYVAGLDQAAADLRLIPPDVDGAQAALTALESRTPASRALLDPISADLRAQPDGSPDALRRLDGLRQSLALPPGSTCHVDPAAAGRALDNVYASPVFANLDQKPEPSIFERIGEAVAWLARHVRDALGAPGSVILGVLVLGALLALAAFKLRSRLGARTAALGEERAESGTDPDAEWRRALAAAQRGDHREAIRRAFRSALLDAAGRGRVRVDAAWTTRELLQSISGDPPMRAAVLDAAAAFDFAWYSGRPSEARDWEAARARCEVVRALARHARTQAAA